MDDSIPRKADDLRNWIETINATPKVAFGGYANTVKKLSAPKADRYLAVA